MMHPKKIEIDDEPERTDSSRGSLTSNEGASNEAPAPSLTKPGTSAGEADGQPLTESAGGDQDLDSELQKARQEAEATYDRLLRVSAEFDNYRKRAQREAEEFRKFANESFAKDLLPVVDNLERAIQVSRGAEEGGAVGVVEGIEMTLRELLKVFEKHHVTPVESLGKVFDPNFHEAVMQEATEAYPPNTIVTEMQKGYLIRDRLLRPALVVVAKEK